MARHPISLRENLRPSPLAQRVEQAEFRPVLADGRRATLRTRQLLSHTPGRGYRFFETKADGPHARARVSDGMDETVSAFEGAGIAGTAGYEGMSGRFVIDLRDAVHAALEVQ